ncbi:acyl-CoA reductase [Paenibacillus baekrokdamisoli]|uniref:Acyl-CoA reductase n=1 Tax=Paenibacillus baekrokdamisoli TaxID=1712516 RepID=A0A3G9JD81_9BACL|nr:BadF/BadG/BcrA/BcrD ATPase family protein [Paenibacillus baekrokdamisoli]MBB3071560.1 N-acetylglucosamine kinase-like BadF-type ATPase [Paenibacillus baekrokdamisoli]BBH21928.1 acyl-CoA reductase [Paenibacillus baekrokdamisoli]
MLRRDVFLGIDGGGTHSTAIAVDLEGNVLAKVIGESINYYSLGMKRARHHLIQIMDQILEKVKIESFESVYIGNSALSQEATAAMIDEFTSGIIKSGSVYMHSDSYIALIAMTIGKPGILIISGTGSMGIAKGLTDELLNIGGWGYLLGDYGSAYHIALQGIQAAVAAEEGMSKATMLKEALKRYFAALDMRDLIDKFYNPPLDRHIIAGFASEVAKCAEQSDEVALKLVKQAAHDLANHALELEKRLNIQGVPIGASGSVFTKNNYIFDEFKGLLEQNCPFSAVRLIDFPPEFGAIFACFHENKILLEPSIQQRMKLTYELLKEE